MPKKVLQVTNFSGGLNCYSDARDIRDEEFAQNWNASVDKHGIVRVAGMAEHNISTDYHNTLNFEPGFGLFQFSSDYAMSEIDGQFNSGTTSGTLAVITTGASVFTLEDISTTSSTNDYYNGMTMFIYSGAGIGESREIIDYVGSTRVITTKDFATDPLHDVADGNPSKYIIFRWKTDGSNWGGSAILKDYVTNGINANMEETNLPSSPYDNYYAITKQTSITDETTKNLGYIEYNPKVVFQDTGLDQANGSTVAASGSSVELTVDGGLATNDLLLGKDIYKSDGTFIGTCTRVENTTTIHFSGGTMVEILNNTDLYIAGFNLIPGNTYNLTFDAAADDRWYNLVSDGVETGIVTSGIVVDEGSHKAAGTTGVINVDGATGADLAAMQVLIKDKDVYRSDGAFVGHCTAVAHTSSSDGTVTFGSGTQIDLRDNDILFTGEYGERVPWVELFSPTVATTEGSIRTFTTESVSSWDATNFWPLVTIADNVGGNQESEGNNAVFNISVNGSGVPTFILVDAGTNYNADSSAPDDVLTFVDPGDTTNTCDITVTSINQVGLTLQHGQWKSGTENHTSPFRTNYMVKNDVNYVDNGDFQNLGSALTGGADHSSDDIAWSLLSKDGTDADEGLEVKEPGTATNYGAEDGTVRISKPTQPPTWTSSGGGQSPNQYIEQTFTLDVNTWYHLNFLFSQKFLPGLKYQLVDETSDEEIDIQIWTDLGSTFSDAADQDTDYYFVGTREDEVGTVKPGVDARKDGYVKFFVPPLNRSVTTTRNIKLRFTVAGSSDSWRGGNIAGVTVHKAYNDLLTMSADNNYKGDPFTNQIETFTNYSLKFTVPENYSSDNAWTLRFHAGHAGYRSGNNLGQTQTQKVYFDNIKLFAGGELESSSPIVTLLSDNNSINSNIHMFSTKSGWIKNFITFNNLNSKPVFDYINGMIKVSDGNFNNTSNSNVIAYIDSADNKWKVTNLIIPEGPSATMADYDAGAISSNKFIGCDANGQGNAAEPNFLNKYHEGLKWQPNPGIAGVDEDRLWRLDMFAKSPSMYHGLVVRHCYHHENLPQPGGSRYGEPTSFQQTYPWQEQVESDKLLHWLVPNSDYFKINILNEQGTGQHGTGVEADMIYGGGYSDDLDGTDTVYGSYNDLLLLYTSSQPNNINPNIPINKPRNPIYIPILANYDYTNPDGTITNIGMTSINGIGDIAKVKVEIMHNTSGWQGSIQDSNWPKYKVSLGVLDENSLSTDLKSSLETGSVISFDSSKHLDETYNIGYGPGNINNDTKIWYKAIDVGQQLYDTGWDDKNISVHNKIDGLSDGVWPFWRDISFTYEIDIEECNWSKNDNLILRIEEVMEDGVSGTTWGTWRSLWRHFYHSSQNAVGASAVGGVGVGTYQDLQTTYFEGEGNYFNSQYSSSAKKYSFGTRFFINKFEVEFYSEEVANFLTFSIGNGKETEIHFAWRVPEIPSLGWGGRVYKMATTSVNIFEEESGLKESSSILGEDASGESLINEGDAPELSIAIGTSQLNDPYIKKTKFYMKDTESDIWYLQFYVDHKKRKLYSTTSNGVSNEQQGDISVASKWIMDRKYLKDFNEVNSYESETMVSQEDASSTSMLTCKYKTSVVANNRMYVGNILQNGKIQGDRMIKSPIGKYNLFPVSNFIDVVVNDGDEITALAYYKDKLLQFKKRKVFIINTSGDYEFLEDTFENVGVNQQCSIVTTPYGIVWANKYGCFLYDGKEKENLIKNKIAESSSYADIADNYWYASTSGADYGTPVVGYDEIRDTLVVKFTMKDVGNNIPNGATYHFPTESWGFLVKAFEGLTTEPNTGNISNMITNTDGEILYYRYRSANASVENGIKKYTNSPLIGGSNDWFYFTTKDFIFGDIAARKKIHKVYVTYKTANSTNSGVLVYARTNGSGSFAAAFNALTSVFAGTDDICYNGSTGLLDTGGEWKTAELKFTTSSTFNNIYSFQLQFLSGDLVSSDFEINDISIVYRTKNIK